MDYKKVNGGNFFIDSTLAMSKQNGKPVLSVNGSAGEGEAETVYQGTTTTYTVTSEGGEIDDGTDIFSVGVVEDTKAQPTFGMRSTGALRFYGQEALFCTDGIIVRGEQGDDNYYRIHVKDGQLVVTDVTGEIEM